MHQLFYHRNKSTEHTNKVLAMSLEEIESDKAFLAAAAGCPTFAEMIVRDNFIGLVCSLFSMDSELLQSSLMANLQHTDDDIVWTSNTVDFEKIIVDSIEHNFQRHLAHLVNGYFKTNSVDQYPRLTNKLDKETLSKNWIDYFERSYDNLYHLLAHFHTQIKTESAAEALLRQYPEKMQATADDAAPKKATYLYRGGEPDHPCTGVFWADNSAEKMCLSASDRQGKIKHIYFKFHFSSPGIDLFNSVDDVEPVTKNASSFLLDFFVIASEAKNCQLVCGDINSMKAEDIDLESILPFCFGELPVDELENNPTDVAAAVNSFPAPVGLRPNAL